MFKTPFIKVFVIVATMMCQLSLQAQPLFNGSFLMSFKSSNDKGEDPPMLWNIEPVSRGGEMAMELQDEMLKKGVSKRVLFNPKDSTWTMLMSFNNVKQGSRMHRAEMFRKNKNEKKIKTVLTKHRRVIEGHKCKKLITESKNYKSEIWVTSEHRFDLCRLYKLLSHCSMMSEAARTGDWFYASIEGIIIEVTSTKKTTGESYTLNISSVKFNEINPALFTIKDFRISDIPEGQNCGVTMDEK